MEEVTAAMAGIRKRNDWSSVKEEKASFILNNEQRIEYSRKGSRVFFLVSSH